MNLIFGQLSGKLVCVTDDYWMVTIVIVFCLSNSEKKKFSYNYALDGLNHPTQKCDKAFYHPTIKSIKQLPVSVPHFIIKCYMRWGFPCLHLVPRTFSREKILIFQCSLLPQTAFVPISPHFFYLHSHVPPNPWESLAKFSVKIRIDLRYLNSDIACFENSIDPDQLASKKPADLAPHCFSFCFKIHATCKNLIWWKLGKSVLHKTIKRWKLYSQEPFTYSNTRWRWGVTGPTGCLLVHIS